MHKDDIPIRQVICGQVQKQELKAVPIRDLIPYKSNPRKNDNAVAALAKSLSEFGYVKNSILVDENMELLAGHTTLKAMVSLGWDKVPEVTQVSGLTAAQKKGYRIADNKLGELAEWDPALLLAEIADLKMDGFDIALTGFTDAELKDMDADLSEEETHLSSDDARTTLAEIFGVPPFTIFDARQGYWQKRKQAWLALGIKSEIGRGGGNSVRQ